MLACDVTKEDRQPRPPRPCLNREPAFETIGVAVRIDVDALLHCPLIRAPEIASRRIRKGLPDTPAEKGAQRAAQHAFRGRIDVRDCPVRREEKTAIRDPIEYLHLSVIGRGRIASGRRLIGALHSAVLPPLGWYE